MPKITENKISIKNDLEIDSKNKKLEEYSNEKDLYVNNVFTRCVDEFKDEYIYKNDFSGTYSLSNFKIENLDRFLIPSNNHWDPIEVAENKNDSLIQQLEFIFQKDERREQIIDAAWEESPHAKLYELPKIERDEILRSEWLSGQGPLTGLCTGLAIECLLDVEINGKATHLSPSDEARYWIKMHIPMMQKVADDFNCDVEDLTEERHYDAMHKYMVAMAAEKTQMKPSIKVAHAPLNQLGKTLAEQSGHCIVCLETPGNKICENHTIYFNPAERLISDNGVLIEVPQDDDYSQFVDFYMKKYTNDQIKFTLIDVQKDPNFDSPRRVSLLDRASLSARLTWDSFISPFNSRNQSVQDVQRMLPPTFMG
jgi:hypothetical protein